MLERTRASAACGMRCGFRAARPAGSAAEDARRLDELRRARAQALRAELRAPAQMLSDVEVLAERGEVFFEGLVRDYPQLFARTPDYRCDDLAGAERPADLLVYFAGPHALHVFTLTPGAACWDRTADGARVAREARFFAACLESQSADSLAQLPLGRSLAAALVPRHAALRAAGALRIVASGFVDQVPFDALPDGDGQLIVHHHATSRIPSLTVLGELANLGRLASGPVVVCEMPRIDAAVLDRFGIVPLLRRARPFLIAAQEIASEALSLERFLGLGRYAPCLVHLTTHGVIDADSGLPVLWLAGEQGALVPEDLATTRFERSVIVLQSCRSAHGLDLGGEGQVDFEKAFLGAGCLAVVDSHQPMSLKWSDRLFTAFYDALAHGHDLAESMRQARLSLIGSDASEPASAWAFPRVVGAGETEVSLPRRPAIAPLLMLAASACAVAAWWSATRRRAGAQPERGWR
ncbi:MAG: CHAT domain-containing protein [Planctomycetota bacterium]